MKENTTATCSVNRYRIDENGSHLELDNIPLEEPLLILCANAKNAKLAKWTDFSMTLRSPGEDALLATGLLFAEGIIEQASDVVSWQQTVNQQQAEPDSNQIRLVLNEACWQQFCDSERRLSRRYPSYGGCGLCGKTHLQALELKSKRAIAQLRPHLTVALVRQIRTSLASQPLFSGTGGVHAAGFIPFVDGSLQWSEARYFEDIGRHNALDKLVGVELTEYNLNRSGILVLSGRVGFELVQKAVMAGFASIVALGAPSQLAVQAALRFGITLVGFAKDNQFNLYSWNGESMPATEPGEKNV